MSDEARPPEDEAQRPTPPTAPGVGLDKATASGAGSGRTDASGAGAAARRAEQGSWAPPVSDGGAEPTASAEDIPLASTGLGHDGAAAPSPPGQGGAVPSASSGHASAEPSDDSSSSPAGTVASNDPHSWPPPSVHDHRTVTSMPGADGTAPVQDSPPPSQPWANPFAPPSAPASGTTDPFGPPETLRHGPAADPFAPPNPFAPPTGPTPYAAQRGHVPPPPIAPDGPGQVPYGYPGGGYGHPAAPPQGYYGWPGMHPLPSNGMGTAGLILGILSALVFCLWPLAIVLGILGVIFGAVGRGKARRGVATNPGQALAGIICGAVGIALGIGMVVLLIAT